MKRFSLILLVIAAAAMAAPHIQRIPRKRQNAYFSSGVFEGGVDQSADLARLRFAYHRKEKYERWVVDFSKDRGKTRNTSPRFQVRYVPKNEDNGPRLILLFRKINKNEITRKRIEELIQKSRFVKAITMYPPIEGGDMAIDFALAQNVVFNPHQPLRKAGRLVLDLMTR